MRIGSTELKVLDAGTFLYDGGAMFGVVPKVIWGERMRADDLNRVELSAAPLLVKTPDSLVLVDTGFGTRLGKREKKIFEVDTAKNVVAALEREGVAPEQIDIVVLTHLHIDHAGGATSAVGGELVPTFPNATYVINSREWAAALEPNPMSAAAYRADDFVPLEAAGRVMFVEGRRAISDVITVEETGGHTAGHMLVKVETPEATAVYPADLIPSRHHLRAAYVPAVDLFPLDVIAAKKALLESAAEHGWTLILDHDPGRKCGRVERAERGDFVFVEVDCA